MSEASGSVQPAVGSAITARSAAWFSTPILMPANSVVLISCELNYGTGGYGSGFNFFYFPNSTNNGIIGRSSSDKNLRYRYSTVGSYYSNSGVFGNKTVRSIELKPAQKLFTLSFSDGTTLDSTQSRPNDSWLARASGLYMHLTPNFYVKRITQTNAGGVVAHDIVPAVGNGVVGMFDMVDHAFYPYAGDNAAITTIT